MCRNKYFTCVDTSFLRAPLACCAYECGLSDAAEVVLPRTHPAVDVEVVLRLSLSQGSSQLDSDASLGQRGLAFPTKHHLALGTILILLPSPELSMGKRNFSCIKCIEKLFTCDTVGTWCASRSCFPSTPPSCTQSPRRFGFAPVRCL